MGHLKLDVRSDWSHQGFYFNPLLILKKKLKKLPRLEKAVIRCASQWRFRRAIFTGFRKKRDLITQAKYKCKTRTRKARDRGMAIVLHMRKVSSRPQSPSFLGHVVLKRGAHYNNNNNNNKFIQYYHFVQVLPIKITIINS